MNRLKDQTSPYLLQHAGNPVDWYPWGDEAFQAARQQDKPIFLSIGYSTCHWCHVMERESFEDAAVADLLNAGFVSIKVDREERPDIDEQYMSVAQMLTGSGGWPLSIVMTPERRPFFAATYIPKHSRHGRPGMMELLPRLQALWRQRRVDVESSAAQILQALQGAMGAPASSPEDLPAGRLLQVAFQALAEDFDPAAGGFGRAPKFPMPHCLSFLLRYWKRTGASQALHMVEKTLQAMRAGGVFDQVGLGFHRYSTDARWLLPHFEKMLYDQALLALAYTEAFQATGGGLYARTAREILQYVLRDLRSDQGVFFSAEDADSEGEEGRFYVWSAAELEELLSPDQLRELRLRVPLLPEGNYADEASGKPTGANVLHIAGGDMLPEPVRLRLLEARQNRPRPLRDDKVLTGWNGLMIAALARAGAVFGDPELTAAARRAADVLLGALVDGRLGRTVRGATAGGTAGGTAFAEDYAYLAWGLIELYEASFHLPYLLAARRLTDTLLEEFWEEGQGGGAVLYSTARSAEQVLVRPRTDSDGALPSPTSVCALNLLRLSRLSQDSGYEARALGLLRPVAPLVDQHPRAFCFLLQALDFHLGPPCEIVISGDPERDDTRDLAAAARREFLPNKVLLLRPEDEGQARELAAIAPFTLAQTSQAGRAAAYVCRDYACRRPTSDVEELLALLRVAQPGKEH